jgi:ribosomal protein S19
LTIPSPAGVIRGKCFGTCGKSASGETKTRSRKRYILRFIGTMFTIYKGNEKQS